MHWIRSLSCSSIIHTQRTTANFLHLTHFLSTSSLIPPQSQMRLSSSPSLLSIRLSFLTLSNSHRPRSSVSPHCPVFKMRVDIFPVFDSDGKRLKYNLYRNVKTTYVSYYNELSEGNKDMSQIQYSDLMQ